MNIRVIVLTLLLGISNFQAYKSMAQKAASANKSSKSSNPFYMGLFAQAAIPQGPSVGNLRTFGGIRIDAGRPFRKLPWLSRGLEVNAVFGGTKKDNFKGLEVTTGTNIYGIHGIMRWTPVKSLNVKPYFDMSAGWTVAGTETTSEVVDRPTFVEQVLWGQEETVDITSHKSSNSTATSFGIGTGVIIKRILMIGVRFKHTNPINYIDKSKVFIKDNSIEYEAKRISLDVFEVTIGISNWGSR